MAVELSDTVSDCQADMAKSHFSSFPFTSRTCRLLTRNMGKGPARTFFKASWLDRSDNFWLLYLFKSLERLEHARIFRTTDSGLEHDAISTWRRADSIICRARAER